MSSSAASSHTSPRRSEKRKSQSPTQRSRRRPADDREPRDKAMRSFDASSTSPRRVSSRNAPTSPVATRRFNLLEERDNPTGFSDGSSSRPVRVSSSTATMHTAAPQRSDHNEVEGLLVTIRRGAQAALTYPTGEGSSTLLPTSARHSRRQSNLEKLRSSGASTSSPTLRIKSKNAPTAKEKTVRDREKREVEKEKERKQRISEWSKQPQKVANTHEYREILRKIKRQEKMTEQRPYARTYPEPRITEKLRIYKVVLKGENKGHEVLDAKAIKEANKKWKVNFPIGIEERELGDTDFQAANKRMCFKWQGYERGTWELASEFASNEGMIEEYQLRLFRLDTIEHFIKEILGGGDKGTKAFKKAYPNRYLKWENGEGHYGHVTQKRTLYITRLRAIEDHFNFVNEKFGLPRVYIEDWTDNEEELDKALSELFYTQASRFTNEVLEIMKDRSRNLDAICCGPQCSTRKKPCTYNTGAPCCVMDKRMSLDNEDVPHFIHQGQRASRPCHFRVECTNKCGCTSENCRNRVVQRGRQHVLVIFRDVKKEWTLRCVSEFKSKEFVMEYVGRVRLGSSTGRAQQYDFDLGYDAPGHEESLKIAGYKVGNESRYISHCCTPSLIVETTVIERYGLFLNHIVMRADKDIKAGQELTFDYCPLKDLSDVDVQKMFPHGCFCESPGCRFTKKMMDKVNAKGDNEGSASATQTSELKKTRKRKIAEEGRRPAKRSRIADEDAPSGSGTQQAQREAAKKRQREAEGEE